MVFLQFFLTNKQNLVGAVVGCLAGGPLSDLVVAIISKRRNGYFEPEFRLWCLIPPFIFGPIGLILWGAGLGDHMKAMVAIAGSGITYAVLCAVPAIGMTYVVDCCRPLAGETMTVLTAFKNTFAFALSFGVFPWLAKDGFVKVSHLPWTARSKIYLADMLHIGRRVANPHRGSAISHNNSDVHIRQATASANGQSQCLSMDVLLDVQYFAVCISPVQPIGVSSRSTGSSALFLNM